MPGGAIKTEVAGETVFILGQPAILLPLWVEERIGRQRHLLYIHPANSY